MKMNKTQKSRFRFFASIFILSLPVIFLASHFTYAERQDSSQLPEVYMDDKYRVKAFEDVACLVISVEGSASITRGHTRVRNTIREGDVIFKGDSANLSYGAKLSLSFDPNAYDLMRFEGPCLINFVGNTQIELSHGKVMTVLGSTRPVRLFKIKTPGAVATAKDAHFLVNVKHQGAEIQSFQSEVKVYGINPVGEERGSGVTVPAGYKTEVSSLGKLPQTPPKALNFTERKGAEAASDLKAEAQGWAKEQKEHWMKERFDNQSSQKLKKAPSNFAPIGGDEKNKKVFF